MYGTVARLRLKPGVEEQAIALLHEYETLNIPGFLGEFLYRMDADSNEYYMAVLFASKDAYLANAQSPEQDVRYRQLAALLEREPEWHDGVVAYASSGRLASA